MNYYTRFNNNAQKFPTYKRDVKFPTYKRDDRD
jgi:hypothetical protein